MNSIRSVLLDIQLIRDKLDEIQDLIVHLDDIKKASIEALVEFNQKSGQYDQEILNNLPDNKVVDIKSVAAVIPKPPKDAA